MLVIRRRAGQSVRIGDEIEIEVMEAGQCRVKLGIRAPRSIPVVRGEVRLTGAENQTAARALEGIAPAEVASILRRVRS